MRLLSLLLASLIIPSADAARIKDVASVYGVRENGVLGYGLVTGLNRTGDSQRNEAMIRSLAARLKGLGIALSSDEIRARNVAVVMVTGRLSANARPGHRLDVEVSSAGDARSLTGGVLQLTTLFAPNGEAFATAQGALIVGGYTAQAGGDSSQKNHPTTARVPDGGTVERENPNRLVLNELAVIDWLVHQPDFTTATRMATAINENLGGPYAQPQDDSTVRLAVPDPFIGRVVELVAQIEPIELTIDTPARVVVNERTGTVVMGADVKVSAVAVAHGSMTIDVTRQMETSQPAPLSRGTTVVTQETQIEVKEEEGRLTMVEGTTIGDLVGALNEMGVKPRDLIEILLTMRAAGALHASVETL